MISWGLGHDIFARSRIRWMWYYGYRPQPSICYVRFQGSNFCLVKQTFFFLRIVFFFPRDSSPWIFSTIWGISLGFFFQPPDVCILMVVIFSSFQKMFFLNLKLHDSLGGGFKYFLFSPLFGEIRILANIFQMGWNHQPVLVSILSPEKSSSSEKKRRLKAATGASESNGLSMLVREAQLVATGLLLLLLLLFFFLFVCLGGCRLVWNNSCYFTACADY